MPCDPPGTWDHDVCEELLKGHFLLASHFPWDTVMRHLFLVFQFLMSYEAVCIASLGYCCRFWDCLATAWRQVLCKRGSQHSCCIVMSSVSFCFSAILRDRWHRHRHLYFSFFLLPMYVMNSHNFKRAFPFVIGQVLQPCIDKESVQENDTLATAILWKMIVLFLWSRRSVSSTSIQ